MMNMESDLENNFEVENFENSDLMICSREELLKFGELFDIKSDLETDELRTILINVQLGSDVPEEYQKHQLCNKFLKCFTHKTIHRIKYGIELSIFMCGFITIMAFIYGISVIVINKEK
jgi:hypothetical protein